MSITNTTAKRFALGVAGIVAAIAGGTGCRPTGTDDHGHEHPEESATAQITVWTNGFEVFAEHVAPVAGEGVVFITHITNLDTFEPRRDGLVKFLYRQNDAAFEHPQARPARDGIYLPRIKFPTAGQWELSVAIPSEQGAVVIDLGIIEVFDDAHGAAHASFPEAPEGVSFLKEQQWKLPTETAPVARMPLVERLRVPARVRAKPGFRADVVAPLPGQLTLAGDAPLRPGRAVEAGELLAFLKPAFSEAAAKVAEADAEFLTAQAALKEAEASYERTKKLADAGAKSPRELQEAELRHHSAQARHAAAAGLLATFKETRGARQPNASLLLELRAPISGILNTVSAGPGEVVAEGQSIFTLLNPETVWIEAAVPEARAARLSAAKDAAFEAPARPGEFRPITGQGRGELLSMGLVVDPETRTIPIIYETLNADGSLRVGENVTLHIETARVVDALAVPESALVEEGGQLIAFVQVSGETFEKREIEAGIRDTGFVQVISGIEEGERVVAKGAYAIRLSSVSGVIPAHGHAH